MDLAGLETFVAVADELHCRRAAERLYVQAIDRLDPDSTTRARAG